MRVGIERKKIKKSARAFTGVMVSRGPSKAIRPGGVECVGDLQSAIHVRVVEAAGHFFILLTIYGTLHAIFITDK